MKPGRNDPCPCGSGKKFKKCCQDKLETPATAPEQKIKKTNSTAKEPATAEINQLVALFNAGQHAESERQTRLLLTRYPASGLAWKVLGVFLQRQGKEAIPALQKSAEYLPDDAEAHNNLASALGEIGRYAEAAESSRRALEINPDFAEAHHNLGTAMLLSEQFDDAVSSFRKALGIKPKYADAHHNLGTAMLRNEQFDDAVSSIHKTLAIKPDDVKAQINLGTALLALGRVEESELSYRRVLQIEPDNAACHSNLLFGFSNNAKYDAATLFAEHIQFGEQFEAPLRISWPQHTHTRDTERCLQVGIVSGDLFNHAIASFIEPVLSHLARLPQLSLHAYYNHTTEDATSQHLRSCFAHWYPVAGLSDAALAEKIQADGIDILIDLSGHTARNRLLTFARKPAPVQASWMGYPGTTGLKAMDYYLADRFFLPPGEFDSQFTEKIVQLPANAPFSPYGNAPPVNALPALSTGHVTFGSFNRLNKINRPVIALWSRLLRALPDSRMVLGGMPEEGKYDTLIELFAQEGINRERLDFHARSNMDHYLELHHLVDICLDTFPYNGATTTLHALWMGVPTLTLAGSTAAGRPGASILGHVGLDDFIAHNVEDYAQKGLSLAGNIAALSDIRTGLRERFAQSAVGQPALIAAGLERALRIMWQRWCADLPPESFEANLSSDIQNDISAQQTIEQALQQAVAQHQSGQLQVAEALYRGILQLNPNHPEANHNLGLLAIQAQQPAAGLPYFMAALDADPARGQYWLSYIDALLQADQLDDARQVLKLARQQGLQGDAVEALAVRLEGGVQITELSNTEQLPPPEEVSPALSPALQNSHKKTKPIKPNKSKLNKQPSTHEMNALLTLLKEGRYAEVITLAQAMTVRFPEDGFGWKAMGAVFWYMNKSADALIPMQKSATLTPNDYEAHNNLGSAYLALGRGDEAEASWRRALQLKPDFAEAYSNLLFCLSNNGRTEAQALFTEHVHFGEQFEAALRHNWPLRSNSPNPERCLQVGIVSGDLHNHAITSFIEPVLSHLAGLPQLSLHAYTNHAVDDIISQRLRGYFAHWHPITALSDIALAKKIQTDEIDILIDLSGHTAKNRLLTFARKPAPVQVSWMGYPGTTGLSSMDYYLADRFFLPPGKFDSQFTEKIVHLPANAPFLPSEHAPAVNTLPALSNSYVTFGSFNRLTKISRPVIALWSQILRALPDSRMVLGGMPEEGKYDTLIEWFAHEGITHDRLSFYARSGIERYMELHHQVDICLDTFPYNGATTTLHALWMGVPTLTLAGSTAAGRPGAAILGHLGLDDFIAHNKEDFVQKGLSLAGNLVALSNIRTGLRERFALSAIRQPALIAAGLERALRIMWQRWCAELPPESFEVSLQENTDSLLAADK